MNGCNFINPFIIVKIIWIEFLGSSDVGKSYWYTKFIQKYARGGQ